MSGFGVDQGAGATAGVVLRLTGEPGKASPIRGGRLTDILYRAAKSLTVIASAAKQSIVRAVDSGLLRRLRLLGRNKLHGTTRTVTKYQCFIRCGSASPVGN
jgi:hypothetical protein